MTLNISVPNATEELRPRITVVGVGGAGGNAVNNMISAKLEGVEFLVTNTDGQALMRSQAERQIQLGKQRTQGLGAGSNPEIGRAAAEESLSDITAELADCHMVFITAGMGGGTGTGAAPVIAKACREQGILTVAIVTKPFDFEGERRMRIANTGIDELQAYVDTLIVIPNQNLFRVANERTTLAEAFAMADDVLHKGVRGITDLIYKPGLVNLDFADIRAVMSEMGKAIMGVGEAEGDNRAINAAEDAIKNPLLDDVSLEGAQALLLSISGGSDMTLFEADEAANHVRHKIDPEAHIIPGHSIDESLEGTIRVSVVVAGMDGEVKAETPRIVKPLATPRATPIETEQPEAEADTEGDAEESESTESEVESEEPFAFSPEPPSQNSEKTPESAESIEAEQPTDESYFSDDPNQHDLIDIVAEDGEPQATESQESQEESEETKEEVAEDKQGGLIRHISSMFGKSSAPEAAPKDPIEPSMTDEVSEDEIETEETSEPIPLYQESQAVAEAEAEEEPQESEAPAEEVAEEEAIEPEESEAPADESVEESTDEPAEDETVEDETVEDETVEDDKVVAIKSPEHPEPSSEETSSSEEEEVDLEIPAFLRRQAN